MTEDLSYIDAEDFLTALDITNISVNGSEIQFSCPSSDHQFGDRHPSAFMNADTTLWQCFSCKKRGNAVTFLSWHKSLPQTVARRLLEERYGGGRISAEVGGLYEEVQRIMNPTPAPILPERVCPNESWIDAFKVDWDTKWDQYEYESSKHDPIYYMIEKRGFSAQILREWEIGYDDYSKRITIPIRDEKGKLVGFKGRSIEDGPYPRYLPLGGEHYGFDPYQKSKYVFGLEKIYRAFKHFCIVVEGELNVLAMAQHGYVAVAIAGSEFSERQRELITTYLERVILYLDNDKAGDKGTKRVIEMLSPYIFVETVQNAAGDAAELDSNSVRELISSAKGSLELQVCGKI